MLRTHDAFRYAIANVLTSRAWKTPWKTLVRPTPIWWRASAHRPGSRAADFSFRRAHHARFTWCLENGSSLVFEMTLSVGLYNEPTPAHLQFVAY